MWLQARCCSPSRHSHRATTVPAPPASPAALSAARDVEEVPAVITLTADPVLETETLQLVRVRMPRLALQAVGVVVSEPSAEGFVEVDVVVGEDWLPRDVRRVALLTGAVALVQESIEMSRHTTLLVFVAIGMTVGPVRAQDPPRLPVTIPSPQGAPIMRPGQSPSGVVRPEAPSVGTISRREC